MGTGAMGTGRGPRRGGRISHLAPATSTTSIATTTSPPPTSTDQPSFSPTLQATRAANTGSIVSTTAAPAVDSCDWAQLWTTKAIAVATTAVTTIATHSEIRAGARGPWGRVASQQQAATVSSCTVAKP